MNTLPPVVAVPTSTVEIKKSVAGAAAATVSETLVPRLAASTQPVSVARWLVLIALTFLVLILVAVWTYSAVSRSLRDARSTGLATLLNTQVAAIQVWVEEKIRFAERWSSDAAIESNVRRIVAQAEISGDAAGFCAMPESQRLLSMLQPSFKQEESVAFHVITPTGRIVASSAGGTCGRNIAGEAFFASISPVFNGKSRFVRPYAGARALPRWTPKSAPRAIIWIEAPIRADDGRVIASLGFGKYASDHFSKLLGVSRPGTTGEAYAFDEQPVLLSESRFRDALAAAGSDAGSAMEQPVRDPGGDLLAGFRPANDPEQTPTLLALAAIASRTAPPSEPRSGVLLEPYRNYRGATVVGAWAWLTEFDLGLALEMDADEAYQPLKHVLAAFSVLFAAVLLFAILFGFSSWSVLKFRLREARQLGQYLLERQIGEGGISKVYLARHTHLKRQAAVKVLKMHLATDELIARFEREAQLCSQLTHPNTIEIFDYGRTRAGVSYYAMEYLSGATLAEIVEQTGPMPIGRAIHVLRYICGSLGEAHEKGLIHRDIKPHNIMLCTKGGAFDVVKVVDFGLVKKLHPDSAGKLTIPAIPDEQPVSFASEVSRDLTQYARVLGTPMYMAPERLRNPADADARADIYAVAAVGFYLLCGRPIFENVVDQALIDKVLNEPVARVNELMSNTVPESLADLLSHCLQKDRALRPDSVSEFVSVLDTIGHAWPWTEFDARSWWVRHGDALRARQTRPTKV